MRTQQFKKYFPFFLFGYHLLFAYVAWKFVLQNHGDATRYWFVGQDLNTMLWSDFLKPGTDVIKLVTFPLVKYSHLPFWAGFSLFNLFSFLGFYRLWLMMVHLVKNEKLLLFFALLLILLPNLHIWTSFIGKEAILFVGLVFFAEGILFRKFSSLYFIFSFFIIAFIRPHVAVILIISFLIALIWKGNLAAKTKYLVATVTTFSAVVLYFLLKKVTHFGDRPLSRIIHIYEYHIRGLQKTDAYVPLDQYPLPLKIFTFYFRPLPFQKSGLLYQIWSFENLILLLMSGAVMIFILKNFKKLKWDLSEVFSLLFIFLLALMYVYAYANYGLIARTKIMAMPFFYILIVKIFGKKQSLQ